MRARGLLQETDLLLRWCLEWQPGGDCLELRLVHLLNCLAEYACSRDDLLRKSLLALLEPVADLLF